MIFYSSPFYLIFLAMAVTGLVVLGARRRVFWLTSMNLALMWISFALRIKHAAVLIVLLLLTYLAASVISSEEKKRRGAALFLGGALLACAVWILSQTLGSVGAGPPWRALIFHQTMGLLGMSFLLLKCWHVLIDLLSGRIKQLSGLVLLNYLTFFPTFLSGPILRYSDFERDLLRPVPLNPASAYSGVVQIIRGFFKKFVLANTLGVFSIDQINSLDVPGLSTSAIVFGLYAFTFTLYWDFSGYSDIARGGAMLLGIQCPENFKQPLQAANLQQFWSRWHISFTGWLKDYVFFPFAKGLHSLGIRSLSLAMLISLWVTFLFAGFWHGPSGMFIAYGGFHALGVSFVFCFGVIAKKLSAHCGSREAIPFGRLWRGVAIVLTFNYVSFGWVFFLGRTDIAKELIRRLI